MKCKNCGSENVQEGITFRNSENESKIGFPYETKHTMGIAAVYADVCLDCGEVLRIYVKDTAKLAK